MEINELKEGDVFVAGVNLNYINKFNNDHKGKSINIHRDTGHYYKDQGFTFTNLRKATPEQKHWLEVCEKADKFIPYDEAMKSFVKEFELPKYWWVQPTNKYEFDKVISYFQQKFDCDTNKNSSIKIGQTFGYIDYYGEGFYYNLSSTTLSKCVKLTFDQFRQYVLKENTLPYKILKQDNNTILQVENSEGSVFDIGDVIINLNGKFKQINPILEFRLSKDNTMCVITQNYSRFGISIDKIEHYIEPKVEESLLDKAKRLYPVGTKNLEFHINLHDYHKDVEGVHGHLNLLVEEVNGNCITASVYTIDHGWAEIISKPETDNSKYEILSFTGNWGFNNKSLGLFKLTKDGDYKWFDKGSDNSYWKVGYNKETYLNKRDFSIYSIKQLSTSDIFTVGDQIEIIKSQSRFYIKSIKLINDSIVFYLIINQEQNK